MLLSASPTFFGLCKQSELKIRNYARFNYFHDGIFVGNGIREEANAILEILNDPEKYKSEKEAFLDVFSKPYRIAQVDKFTNAMTPSLRAKLAAKLSKSNVTCKSTDCVTLFFNVEDQFIGPEKSLNNSVKNWSKQDEASKNLDPKLNQTTPEPQSEMTSIPEEQTKHKRNEKLIVDFGLDTDSGAESSGNDNTVIADKKSNSVLKPSTNKTSKWPLANEAAQSLPQKNGVIENTRHTNEFTEEKIQHTNHKEDKSVTGAVADNVCLLDLISD